MLLLGLEILVFMNFSFLGVSMLDSVGQPSFSKLVSSVRDRLLSFQRHLLVILKLRSDISDDLLAITTDTTQTAAATLGRSLESAFDAIAAAIQPPDGNTNTHITDIQKELAIVCQSSRQLLAAVASGNGPNVEREMLFAQNATDVERLMRSVAFANETDSSIDVVDDDDDSAAIPTATPLFVLTNALALVHSVHHRCAHVLGHPLHSAHAIRIAAESTERLYAETLRRQIAGATETKLNTIISMYTQSLQTKLTVSKHNIEM